ncbi:G-type lectin S-receptor-like serine/threonine-protein kinase LECRK3 [Argentina anserina]|uniref:G-type lectin S-receptor-like serine/threonine-protein kinase LECRK3 n=1 Tax=Argentina anserina TaxID=57926 RepID=UPI0021767B04|nr:G-type lectin S-receptor-like serine/threonine-protein kinase LECRK3 [Potentilla anserina]
MAFPVYLVLLSSIFLLLPTYVLAQIHGRIAVGASLSTAGNSSWLSPFGDFAFGFQQLENNDLFLLSIWFDKVPDKTIVWYANGDKPAPDGSVVTLTANSGLVLTSPQGEQLWKSNQTIAGVVSHGVMNDTGNFVLEDVKSVKLWETFNNPTDTMLPGQVMQRGGKLSSRKSETDYSRGSFTLNFEDDGNLVFTAQRPFYSTGTTTGFVPGSEGLQLVFNDSGNFYILRVNGGHYTFTAEEGGAAKDVYYLRSTLSFDGILAQYFLPKNFSGNVSWVPLWSAPPNICKEIEADSGPSICGTNSICTLKEDKRPTCVCLPEYSSLDPEDPSGSCYPTYKQGCKNELSYSQDLYHVQVLENTDWLTSSYEQLNDSTADTCSQSCLQDCSCAVAIYSNQTCRKKRLPLSYGREDRNFNATTFVKLMTGLTDLTGKNNKSHTFWGHAGVGTALLGTSVFVNFMLGAAICLGLSFGYFRRKHAGINPQNNLDTNLKSFSHKELEEATNGFNEELGKGSFGVVYKGIIQIGSGVQVAVKKLHCVIHDGEREFKTELNIIGRTHHKNLVHLVGYCDEGQHRSLVYEFLSNGTLASFLFGDEKPSWRQRMEIAYDVAKGLLYLHEECTTQIIHCDIKPQNILLDDNYIARISDFGLAKLLMTNQSQTHTAIRGTKGYVAPEWFRNMPITTKVDVYSFGVVLLEIIFCRRSVDMETNCEEKAILIDWVYDCYLAGMLESVLDHKFDAVEGEMKLEETVMIALWCIQEKPSLRPAIRQVVQMLEGLVQVQVPPCPSS